MAAVTSAQSDTYPDMPYAGPVPVPQFPAGFSAYNPPVTNTAPVTNAPAISQWTRQNQPGDTMALTGSNFSSFTGLAEGRDTHFIFYGAGLPPRDGAIQRLTGLQAAITLPDEETLDRDEMYLLWARNKAGYSAPVAINQTEAWWVGPNRTARGGAFSVYGRNLQLGTDSCYLYIEELDRWLESSSNNPYKADFVLPQDLPVGTYTIWTHNTHGGKYGWSDALSLEVVAPIVWSGTVIDVTAAPYNAAGDGITDDWQAITDALLAAGDYDTVHFPAGTYAVSKSLKEFNSKLRVTGDGMDLSIIKPHSTFVSTRMVDDHIIDAEFSDLSFESGAKTIDNMFLMGSSSANVKFTRVGFSQLEDPLPGQASKNPIFMKYVDHITFKDCRFIFRHSAYAHYADQIFFDGCDFYGIQDANSLFEHTVNGLSVINSTAQPLDHGKYDNDADGTGIPGERWSKGRWYTAKGVAGAYTRNWYFGNNTTTDMCPRKDSLVDQNSGEQINIESLETMYRGRPVAATRDAVVFPDLSEDHAGSIVAVIDGTGLGQHRVVTSFDAATKTITVDKPWRIVPDSGSLLMIGHYAMRVAVYNNRFDGLEHGVTSSSDIGSSGIDAYGGFFDLAVDRNLYHQVRSAIEVWSLIKDTGTAIGTMQPNYFNYFAYNRIDRCRFAMENRVSNFQELQYYEDVGLLGNVFRGNVMTDMESTPVTMTTWETYPSIGMSIFDGNTVSNAPAGVNNFDPGYWRTDESSVMNQIYVGNHFRGIASGQGIIISQGSTASFRKNDWGGASYAGDTIGAVLELPVRVISIDDTSATEKVTIANCGTAPLTWSATSDKGWLEITQASGTVADENIDGTLIFNVDPSAISEDETEAVITITSTEGDTKQMSVEYAAAASVPPPPDPPPAPVLTKIEISGPDSVDEGSTAQYICTASYSDGSATQVSPTWNEDSDYAGISSSGTLSAGDVSADESTTVSAEYSGLTATQAVTIRYVPAVLTSIAITGPSAVDEESTAQYTCTATYSDGSTAVVDPAWSDNSSYAALDGSGILTTEDVAADRTIIVTAQFGGLIDTHAVQIVYIPPELTGITITGAASVHEETSAQYICTASYSDGTSAEVSASWSENSADATISASGLLAAGNVAADQAITITAEFDGMTDTQSVTILYVPPVLTGITVSGPSAVDEGSAALYSCTATYSDGSSIAVTPTWSENSAYATISSAGLLSAGDVTADQAVTVTASFAGMSDTHPVTITYIPPSVTGITVSGPSSLDEESTVQYTCTASYSDGTSAVVSPTWTENSAHATISAAGLLSAGNVTADQHLTVTASFEGLTDSHSVTILYVAPVLTGITISGPSSVNEESTARYVCTADYSDGTRAEVVPDSWSENSAFAAISGSGVLNAGDVSASQDIVVAASFEGESDTYAVVIVYVPPTVTGITVSGPQTVEENSTVQYTCTAHFSDGSSSAINPAWSDNSASASIDGSGVLTVGNIAADEVLTVQASYEGRTAMLSLTVMAVGDRVVFQLSGFEGKTVSAELWDDVAQTMTDLGEESDPEEIVIEHVNPDQWYWLGLREYDPGTGEWVLVQGRWIWM